MKAPIRIGLQPGVRVLYIEREPIKYHYAPVLKTHWEPIDISGGGGVGARLVEEIEARATKVADGYWLIPQSTNPERTLGVFLRLYDNGKIERVTVREDEGDEVVLIKPEDKHDGTR